MSGKKRKKKKAFTKNESGQGRIAQFGESLKETSENIAIDRAVPLTEKSFEPVKRTPSELAVRVGTAIALIALLVVSVIIGGWFYAAFASLFVLASLYEEMRVLSTCHNPLWWPSFVGLVLGVPLMMTVSNKLFMLMLTVLSFCIILGIMRRKEPLLQDILVSMLPLLSVVLPGMCLVGLAGEGSHELQPYLMTLVFITAIMSDTCAFFVGRTIGGPKLCPNISPKKTISGSVGGLVGCVAFTMLARLLFKLFAPSLPYPPWWADLSVGFLAGVAAQAGDLFASLVKRHCKVKDFGHLLPGHGGALDRIDSILFTAVILFCYKVFLENFTL